MKTKLISLILLIVCFSCGTNNKPVTDTQKEKIKGEVKEVVNTLIKACEELNIDTVMQQFLDSPDFIYISDGMTSSYKELVDGAKLHYSTLLNQKCTEIVNEKYAVLDNSTVLYTNNSKWLTNSKDGLSILSDPWVSQYTFRKINNKWKIVNDAESGRQQIVVGNENSIKLNQAELLRKFVGNWEIPLGKDTSEFVVIKSLQGGNGLNVYAKFVTKGKMLFEGTGFWGYDDAIKKIDISVMSSTGDVVHDQGAFTSPNKLEFVNINNAKAYKGISKSMLEFNSPDEIKRTDVVDNRAVIQTWKRIK